MTPLSSWGALNRHPHDIVRLEGAAEAAQAIASHKPGLARGMGRSYGDVCLNPGGTVWSTVKMDRFTQFEPTTGALTCESGVLLRDIQSVFARQGWTLPVTPGTQFVTLGGAIANDVHGKNHHVTGSLGNHIVNLRLIRTDGSVIDCGPEQNADWFAATVGGIGLTGVITQATVGLVKIPGPYLDVETLPFDSLADFFALADASEADWEHTVSWIDCLSPHARGLFMRGRWTADRGAPLKRRRLSAPLTPPLSLINPLSLRAFNNLYFNLGKRKTGTEIVHYERFFYPLDSVQNWNRIYGPKGFYQYQSVVPRENGPAATQAMLDEIARYGDGSFLAVLKTFGDLEPRGMLSFARPGVTLALDFANRGAKTRTLFARLDAIVREAQGRLYLAKDARMSREFFEASYLRLNEFLAYRDPGVSSAMSRRLLGS